MKYFKLNAPEELLRCPFVDKQCVGDSCMAWKPETTVVYESCEDSTKAPYPVQIVNMSSGYCGVIWK